MYVLRLPSVARGILGTDSLMLLESTARRQSRHVLEKAVKATLSRSDTGDLYSSAIAALYQQSRSFDQVNDQTQHVARL
jgi:hypothetical protein